MIRLVRAGLLATAGVLGVKSVVSTQAGSAGAVMSPVVPVAVGVLTFLLVRRFK